MKNIWILALVLLCFACSQQKNTTNQNISLAGKWHWEKNDEEGTFSVTIQKEGNTYIGKYCAVALSGNRIDCDYNDPPAFVLKDLPGNEFTVNFKTYYGQGTGKVKIRIEGEKMYWEVVEKPEGQYFCPNVAVLKRTKK
jgi:hypothetical protein